MLWKILKCPRCICNLGRKHLAILYDKEHVNLRGEFYAVVTSYSREEDGEFGLWLMAESKFLQLRKGINRTVLNCHRKKRLKPLQILPSGFSMLRILKPLSLTWFAKFRLERGV